LFVFFQIYLDFLCFYVVDNVRPAAKEMVREMQEIGYEVAMLTGDSNITAEQVIEYAYDLFSPF
jgi:P-type E1-E2 ATPase